MSNIVILGPWIVILSCFILSLPCHRAWQTRPVHSPTILMHSGIGLAEQLRQRGIAVIVDARLKSGSIADSCRGATRVRRAVAPPSQDYCRSGTARVHP